MLNRQQAIIWTNADAIYWCIYAALEWDELICIFIYCISHEICPCIFICACVCSQWICVIHVSISIRVASLALGPLYDCPVASETTLKDMGKNKLNQNTVKHDRHAKFQRVPVNSSNIWLIDKPLWLQSPQTLQQCAGITEFVLGKVYSSFDVAHFSSK